MGAADRIVRRQGLRQGRLWLEAEPARLERLQSLLEAGDIAELVEFLRPASLTNTYLQTLLRRRPDNVLEELTELLHQPSPGAALAKALGPGLQFVSHRISAELLRSCQPRPQDLEKLAAEGLKTVVNLRSESEVSREWCARLDLGYHHLPVEDDHPPTTEQVLEFLDLVPLRAPVLVHCHAGRGRTGTFVACYRIARGLTLEEALALTEKEVPGIHPDQKRFLSTFRM